MTALSISRTFAYVELGRVSNLPTIAAQTASGIALAGVAFQAPDCVLLGVGFSSAYVGGMFLNDAFDWAHDVRHRPDRPIPSGRITVRSAVGAGVALLATSLVAIIADGALHGHPVVAALGASSLALSVFFYDAWHKGNDMAPVVMGLCRALVYVCATLAIAGRVSSDTGTAAGAMLAYVAGLSEISRSSRFSIFSLAMLLLAPFLLAMLAGTSHDVGALGFVVLLGALTALALLRAARGDGERATVMLLAGMPLVDAVVLARFGHFGLAVVVALLVPLTKGLQRLVRGT